MNHSTLRKALLVSLLLCTCLSWQALGETKLWQIGKDDNGNAEFALAPKGYAKFGEDGFFIVGQSDPKRNWPYVHPGPSDAWAGGRSHTFGIAFGLKSLPKAGNCRLVLDFIDTQGQVPPKLRIDINGRAFDRAAPPGAGDDSIFGEPQKGRGHKIEIDFPAELLTAGSNHIAITTLAGSWVLYDWVGLETPPGAELGEASGTLVRSVRSEPVLVERDGKVSQTVRVDVLHFGRPGEATIEITGARPVEVALKRGQTTIEVPVPCVESPTEVMVTAKSGGKPLAARKLTLEPVRKWVVYMLPHSHVDIGYTHVQTDVEHNHWRFYEQAIEAAEKTADYPPGAQFKWNVEVLWATDSYLRQASPEKREAFIDAVRKGWIGLDALYGNELTALCRPEELVRLVDFANRLKRQHSVPIDSAMISDVPGYTWGIVSVLAGSGVKYFSIGPNGGHRIGYTLSQWGDKPFWWRSPCGCHKVLCWIPRTGYWRGFRGAMELMNLLRHMEESEYPYDLVQLRHCLGDNAGPGTDLSEFVKDWNTKYAYPKLIIATTREMMRDFERRYGDGLPEIRGDFTPYWEDGAGSSALETALNRAAAERLVQAEALYAMLNPAAYPADEFYGAWRNVILYDEHTWGAHCSISQPDSDFTKAQWKIKQAFALDAASQSQKLLNDSLAKHRSSAEKVAAIDVFNTCSWPRTDLVVIPKHWQLTGSIVFRHKSGAVPSGRLPTGEIAFLAKDIPALGSKRFTLEDPAQVSMFLPPPAEATPPAVRNSYMTVTLDEKTGAISSIKHKDLPVDLVANDKGVGLNDYFYVAGRDPKEPLRNGPVKISVKEYGSMMASLLVESDAPGCNKLTREVRLISGLDRVDIIDTIDKEKIYKQEAVHLGFAFNVPKGVMRMDVPWGVVRPEMDQLAGACKNYFTVQRWVDVSNDKFGVTLATVDAPLIEVGRITCDARAVGWIKQLKPTQTLYSYVMNNYWETNYKAGQEGPTTFRYSIWPHQKFDAAKAARFGTERSQPLIVVPVSKKRREVRPIIAGIKPGSVVATAFKPSEDGKARIVRLFNAGMRTEKAKISWTEAAPRTVWLSNLAEEQVSRMSGTIKMAAYEFVTLRVPLGQ